MDEKTLKERLEEIIFDVEDAAAEKIMAAFPEFFENEFEPGDAPVNPIFYIDDKHVLFRDMRGRFYFWNEVFTEVIGPYDNCPTACEAMREYAAELDGAKGVIFDDE